MSLDRAPRHSDENNAPADNEGRRLTGDERTVALAQRVPALEQHVAQLQDTIRSLREELADVKQDARSERELHLATVHRLQEEHQKALFDREVYYSRRIEQLQAAQRETENDKVTRILARMEFSQEFLGKEVVEQLKESFAPMTTYAQQMLFQQQVARLCEEEQSLRRVRIVAPEQDAWNDASSELHLRAEELPIRLRLLAEERAAFSEFIEAQEALHRRSVVEVDERDAFLALLQRFYRDIFALSPSRVFTSHPLRQQLEAEDPWWQDVEPQALEAMGVPVPVDGANPREAEEADEEAGEEGAVDVNERGRAAPPRPRRERPEEAEREAARRRDPQVYIQDDRKKEQTFVGGGVLFHLRTRRRDGDVEGNAEPREEEGEAAAPRDRAILLTHFEVVFDEPLRPPEVLREHPNLRELEDNLYDVHISLWCKQGSFLVSARDKQAYVRRRLRDRFPHVNLDAVVSHLRRIDEEENGSGGGRGSSNIGIVNDDDEEGETIATAAGGSVRWESLVQHPEIFVQVGLQEEAEANAMAEAALRAEEQFELEERGRNVDRKLIVPCGKERTAAAASTNPSSSNTRDRFTRVEREEGWVRLFATTEPLLRKNVAFLIPTNRLILKPGKEYSFFIRVDNKKILNFTKRVLKVMKPSPDGNPANAQPSFEEEKDPAAFYYSPVLYHRHNEDIEMSGCRWNARTSENFFSLAPRNDDVFYGRMFYHVL